MQRVNNLFVIIFSVLLCIFGTVVDLGLTLQIPSTQKGTFPAIESEPRYDLQFVDKVIKHHGYGIGEIDTMHFLGLFSSNQKSDQLTMYLRYLSKLTTSVNIIYNYESYLTDFKISTRMKNYYAESTYYCRYKLLNCGYVQFAFGEDQEIITRYWVQKIIDKTYHSPQMPYFFVYISPYTKNDIINGKAKQFYPFLFIGTTSMTLFAVTTTA